MKNNRTNTVFLVLFNLGLITWFSYMLFSGVLQKAFTNEDSNRNKLLPSDNYIISISKTIPSINTLPRQSADRSKRKSSSDNSQVDNTIPTMNLESFYSGRAKSRGVAAARGLSSSTAVINVIGTENIQSNSGLAGGSTIYGGSRKGGTGVSEGTYAGNMPFTDGVSSFPRSSVPRVGGAGTTILIDPMTDPLEENRIPVGEGFGIMLLFAASFAGRVYAKKVL